MKLRIGYLPTEVCETHLLSDCSVIHHRGSKRNVTVSTYYGWDYSFGMTQRREFRQKSLDVSNAVFRKACSHLKNYRVQATECNILHIHCPDCLKLDAAKTSHFRVLKVLLLEDKRHCANTGQREARGMEDKGISVWTSSFVKPCILVVNGPFI
jgi:hypothetical protein